MQICPNCNKENADEDAYCYSCGHILLSSLRQISGTDKLSDIIESLAPQQRWGTAYFDSRSRLELLMRGFENPLTVSITDEVVLGRLHDLADENYPNVDLTPYGAVEKGVSRMHARFMRELNTLAIIDLNSSNGTFLNGQRLMPFEARILRDNDELWLGHMVIRVRFV